MLTDDRYFYPQLAITLIVVLLVARYLKQPEQQQCTSSCRGVRLADHTPLTRYSSFCITDSREFLVVDYSSKTRPSSPSAANMDLLGQLPEEILQETLQYIEGPDLLSFARACRWAYDKAIPLLWEHVELVDCRTTNPAAPDISDEHDDTPIIRKLLTLASNKWIASHVHTLTHRCHLPPPAIFYELPRVSFQGRTLSHDVRTLRLLALAIRNLTNIHTLRIIFGHWNLTRGLLTGLLVKPQGPKLRHLWLENCSLAGISARVLEAFDLGGLESIRMRRLPLLSHVGRQDSQEVYCRGPFPDWRRDGALELRQDGQGGVIKTSTELLGRQEKTLRELIGCHRYRPSPETSQHVFDLHKKMFELLFEEAHNFDQEIYNQLRGDYDGGLISSIEQELSDQDRSPTHTVKHLLLDRDHPDFLIEDTNPFPMFSVLLKSSAATLTSLNLDWVIIQRTDNRASPEDSERSLQGLFKMLFDCRFPCLRAFQLRNAVVAESELLSSIYLLDSCESNWAMTEDMCIRFLEAHPKLRCLAWPADRFFRSQNSVTPELQERVNSVILNLANSLEDLRADTVYSRGGEFKTDNSIHPTDSSKSRRQSQSKYSADLRL